ncbi:hypothetical protein LrDSM24759_03340 [Lactobacillus rodentium]|uniref:Transposase n=1 Tax=Lactobacillus rodentium TaxID=947835 RepID=A0A2Z6TE45_9LACO|nr:hypothetical protein LrDSM24759_03340 [Lactobacillus rodentium]
MLKSQIKKQICTIKDLMKVWEDMKNRSRKIVFNYLHDWAKKLKGRISKYQCSVPKEYKKIMKK